MLLWAAVDGWRRQMVQHGHEQLGRLLDLATDLRRGIDRLPGLQTLHSRLVGVEASRELDELKVFVDLTELGISGYQAADRLRRHHAIDPHLSDHRRVEAMPTLGDDEHTVASLLAALEALTTADLDRPPSVDLPPPRALEAEAVMLPRDAFFAPSEDLSAAKAVGRVCAEQITPYPPGIPAPLPGERVTGEIVDYLQSGVHAGMVIPDAADPEVGTVRVVA